MNGSETPKENPPSGSMLEELLKASSPETPQGAGVDPLAAAEAAVPGSAASVSFVPPAPEVPKAPENVPPTPSEAVSNNPLASIPGIVLEGASDTPPAPVPPAPKKKKEPMRPIDFLKIVGALLVVALIFFGSFLAYIVFNPEQAQFFIQFGINPGDIAILLERLVNGIFGGITFFVSIVWVVYLFRAIVTKKEYKRKKTIATILAFFFGTLLFSNISFWAFLVKKIGAQDFVNPNGGVVIYDNDRLLSEQFKNSSEIYDFNNLIGPVTLKFDLDSDARYAGKLMDIESFEIDFDGDGAIDKDGPDPRAAKDLVFTYDKKGKYVPKGSYIGRDKVSREPKTMPIVIPTINVSAIVVITKTKKGIVYNAKDTSLLGSPKWYESDDLNVAVSTEPVYTAKQTREERFLCLALLTNKTKEEDCSKIFVVRAMGDAPIDAKIKVERAVSDQLTYQFSLEDVKVRTGGDIAAYRWVLDGGTVFCRKEECEWTFNEYGKQKFTVFLTDAAGNTVDIESEFRISRPLSLMRTEGDEPLLKVEDSAGENLLKGTYDRSIEAYRVENFTVPSKLKFDATDVRVKNSGYVLEAVEWTFGNGGPQKSGNSVDYELVKDGRFEVVAKYTFYHKNDDDRSDVSERIVFDGKKKDLVADLKIFQDTEYAPATIRFDGSASRTKQGTITKFVYDFGLGKPAAEGDAIQTLRYDQPGEYSVSLTVVKDDGSKDTATRKIVIKDIPKSLRINTSLSSGFVGKGIDFDVFGSSGQIESYAWDFGDGTPISTEPNPSHVYEKAGTYVVKLQARYADATIRTAEKDVTINAGDSE